VPAVSWLLHLQAQYAMSFHLAHTNHPILFAAWSLCVEDAVDSLVASLDSQDPPQPFAGMGRVSTHCASASCALTIDVYSDVTSVAWLEFWSTLSSVLTALSPTQFLYARLIHSLYRDGVVSSDCDRDWLFHLLFKHDRPLVLALEGLDEQTGNVDRTVCMYRSLLIRALPLTYSLTWYRWTPCSAWRVPGALSDKMWLQWCLSRAVWM